MTRTTTPQATPDNERVMTMDTTPDDRRRSSRSAGRVAALTVLVLALATAGCEGLLDVELPGEVTEDNLNNPAQAAILANSVVAQVECSWDNYVGAASHHSDEWIPASGNSTMRRWGLRRISATFSSYATGGCGESYGLFTPLHIGLRMADRNSERIRSFPDDSVQNKQELLTEIQAYSGWPLIAFAEGFCGTPLNESDQTFESDELFQRAVDRFGQAIDMAQQTGQEQLRLMALVGRARAHLGLGNYDQAISDAEQIPQGFRFDVAREQTPGRRQNVQFDAINALPGMEAGNKHASVAPSYRDVQWEGTDDPRVPVVNTGEVTFDFTTIHWRHEKINSYSTNVRLASWEEARMFIAEAEARRSGGDLDRARQILDGFHQRAGIPGVTESDIPTRDDVIRHVLQERQREFFAEGGHRLHDMLRFRGTGFEIPFLGEAGSDHPDGIDQNGLSYGETTCFPVPTVELSEL